MFVTEKGILVTNGLEEMGNLLGVMDLSEFDEHPPSNVAVAPQLPA